MVMLLAAYAVAMWMFLNSAPKVYTMMASDIKVAQAFYEGMLHLPMADVPLHYYYNYEQTLGATAIDPLYLSGDLSGSRSHSSDTPDGLWYQLKKNAQLHVISGASRGNNNRQRHVCFDRECLETLLMEIQLRGVKYKIRRERPLNVLVKDRAGEIIELSEIAA